jgi:hypothetical protein
MAPKSKNQEVEYTASAWCVLARTTLNPPPTAQPSRVVQMQYA